METFEPLQPPPAIGWWPPAPGWWLLAILCAGLVTFAVWRWWRHRRDNRYRQILARELEVLWQQYRPDQHAVHIPLYLAACCELLRRTWRLLDPGRAALPVHDLLRDLETTPGVHLPAGVITHIDHLLYSRTPAGLDAETLELLHFHQQLLIWSRKHRVEVPC